MSRATIRNVAPASSSALPISANDLNVVEHRPRHLDTRLGEVLSRLRTNARRTESSAHFTTRPEAGALEHKDVLQGNDFLLHAGNFRDRRHFTRAVRQSRNLDDEIDRGRNLLTNRP